MRVIAGKLKGQQFNSPNQNKTHPMSEKIRGALFNSLGDISGLFVLDAFAGSCAIAIEAISRGASKCVAVEKDHSAYKTMLKNIEKLNLQAEIELINANIFSWSMTNKTLIFDLIVADPPYINNQLNLITLKNHLKKNGILVLSWPGNRNLPELNLKMIKRKKYGDSQLVFYTILS